jgi:hypothetical protein
MLPILSGIIVMYRTGKLMDDARVSKESRACQLFLSVARTLRTPFIGRLV